MKHKLGKVLMVCGALLIAGALGLLIYNRLDESRAAKQVNRTLEVISAEISRPEETAVLSTGIGELGSIRADGHEYVGVLSVPSLELELPVMSEWSYPNLKIAPCLYSADIENNSLVIAAHNYASHFGSLNLLSGGESVVFTDVSGAEYRYTVMEIVITEPTDIEGMLDSSWDMTLFTCTYGGAARVTVRCMMSGN